MSRMSDILIEKYERKISILARITGYAFDFLWDIWMDIFMEQDSGDEAYRWRYFKGVTLELDW